MEPEGKDGILPYKMQQELDRLRNRERELVECLKELVEDCLELAHSRWSEFEGSDDDLVGRARSLIGGDQ